MDEPEFYDFDTPEADAPDDAPEDSGFEAGVEVEPSISFPPHGAHWRHSASGRTGAFELTPSGEVTPLSIDVLLRDAQMNDLEVDSEDQASSVPLAPTAVPAFLPLNPMTVRSDHIFTDDDLWELAAELQDANFPQDAAPAPEMTSTDSFAHDLSDMHRDGMFGLKVARKGLDPVLYEPSAPTKPTGFMEPAEREESALPPFFPHAERDDSYFDASSNHSARILHDVTHAHISQRGIDNYQNPERLGWVFRTMIAATLLGSVVYVMHRTNVLHARPSVVLRDMMRYLATSDTSSSVNPLLARHVEAVRMEIAGALPDAGSYSDIVESPIVVSSGLDDFLRPDVLSAVAYSDRELDAGVVQVEKSTPSTLAVLDGSMSEQVNTAGWFSAGEFVKERVEVPAALVAPAAPVAPVASAAPDFSQAEALLHNASAMTKLRKSTVMIRQGTHTFAGFTVAQNVIVTSRKALSDGLISGVYGGEQKVGKMITYFPRKDLTYKVLGDAQSDVAFLVFTKPILKAHNIYKIASSGWEAGDAVATCGHPHNVMDTIRAGIMVQEKVLISSGDSDLSEGYEGSPLVNAKGEVVGMLVHGVPQPLSAAQLQIPKS